MKRTIQIIIALISTVSSLSAQSIDGVSATNVSTERNGKFIAVSMDIDLSQLDVKSKRAVLITPRLVNGNDSTDLKAIGVYGRNRYYYYVRNGESMLTGKEEMSYRENKKPNTIEYKALTPYKDWMDGATLTLTRQEYGCCNTILGEQFASIGNYKEEFFPTLVYVTPDAVSMKTRSLEGSAYIDFPVNKTVIYPEYRRNAVELAKIKQTIDSVRNDKDISITSVWLKGYASPESPYEHNAQLAKGRTAALQSYIQQLYHFDKGVIATEYEPEDWAGLRRYVETSALTHRAEILSIIDSDRDADSKEWTIKSKYPEEYRHLLDYCYPALRHTDYRVNYTIRSYSNVEEIKQVMNTAPQKLSLNEFYLVAQQYEPGTEEFSEVFETAVRMYPADETANLNAANAAMRRDDLTAAKRYLAKAGNSPEAVYARGAYAVRSKDYSTALQLMKQAESMGVKEAAKVIERVRDNEE